MQYRKFNTIKEEVSTFGLGCMRFETIDETDEVDEEKAINMIRHSIDNGVNYIDTAYVYHNTKSEGIIGKALKDGYREKTLIATKLPTWLVKKPEDFQVMIDEQLERLQTDYIDVYLLHSLNKKVWDQMLEFNIFEFLEKMKEEGKIKYIGFSFHDEYPVFKEIFDYYDWDICQIQLNILDQDYQAGIKGLKYAGEHGVPVVIMEPLKGGILTKHIPDDIKAIYNDFDKNRTPADLLFNWVANFPEVITILSGTTYLEQTKENIKILSNALPNSISDEELNTLDKIKNKYEEKIKVGCTDCKYCMPCPSGVDIPENFATYNYSFMFNKELNVAHYKDMVKNNIDGSHCIECGICESLCPQNINVIEKLKEVDNYFR